MTQINETLIHQYAAGATPDGITNLLTLFDFLSRQTTRAEELSRAYLAQMVVLEKRLSVAREGQGGAGPGQPAGQPASSRAGPGPGPTSRKPKPPITHSPTDAIDIDL